MNWVTEFSEFISKPEVHRQEPYIIANTEKCLNRIKPKDKQLHEFSIDEITPDFVRTNMLKIKPGKSKKMYLSSATVDRYLKEFFITFNAFIKHIQTPHTHNPFKTSHIPNKVKNLGLTQKGLKAALTRNDSDYMPLETFERLLNTEWRQYCRFRSTAPQPGVQSNGPVETVTINAHRDAMKHILGFALKSKRLNYLDKDVCLAIVIDPQLLEELENTIAGPNRTKDLIDTFTNTTNIISSLLNANKGFIIQAEQIFDEKSVVFQKYLSVVEKILIRDYIDKHGEGNEDDFSSPTKVFLKIAGPNEMKTIKLLKNAGDWEGIEDLRNDFLKSKFKALCTNMYNIMKQAHKRSLKSSKDKNKEIDGALQKVGAIVQQKKPLAVVKKMVEAMYISTNHHNPTSEDWQCIRAMAIFSFMSAFPLRAKNITNLFSRRDSRRECLFKEKGRWKVEIPPSRLKNGYEKVEMILPEDCSIYLDLWERVRNMRPNEHSLSGYFFGLKPITPNSPASNLGSIMSKWASLYLPEIAPYGINPHGMRHIVATHCKKNGVGLEIASELLLDDAETVRKHYMHQKLGESLEAYYSSAAYSECFS